MRHNQYEAAEQIKLFRWAAWAVNQYPELELLYHIPNGGSRNAIEAAHLKPAPKGKYHGLYIEMKFGDNKPTKKQKEWIEKLTRQGYAVSVCWSYEAARAEIEKYLGLDSSD